MRMYDIIQDKKEGKELTKEQIQFFISGYVSGEIPDYQASALAMAIYFNGMSDRETTDLTMAMYHSGDIVDLTELGNATVDKHSTGGVGDKTTLILAPVVASIGGIVAKMSGRGLGHTGGTVDKLDSIPGFRTEMEPEEFLDISKEHGLCVIGQSQNLTPADKKLYALRDVTATVDSIPLIVSSVMCKKLAAGAKSIVLDVKTGSGAFMKTPEDAKILAEKMVAVGKSCGRNMKAYVTNMDVPLGNNVGNTLEVIEAIDVLKNHKQGDLRNECIELASSMIQLSLGLSFEESREKVIDAIDSGKAFRKMKEWITAQGGDASYLDDTSKFEKSRYSYELKAEQSGFITKMDTEKVGITAALLGAGRQNTTDTIDYSAGIEIRHKTGDYIHEGDTLAVLHSSDENKIGAAKAEYLSSLTFGPEKPDALPTVFYVID